MVYECALDADRIRFVFEELNRVFEGNTTARNERYLFERLLYCAHV